MTLYLIRHGHAEDRFLWSGADMERPLIDKGIVRAEKAFKRFLKLYNPPEKIITSNAVRAYQTAEILHDACGAEIVYRDELNPGASVKDYLSVTNKFSSSEPIAIVGHEPDMSEFISDYLSDGSLFLDFKKGSICVIRDRCLVNLIQQKVLI